MGQSLIVGFLEIPLGHNPDWKAAKVTLENLLVDLNKTEQAYEKATQCTVNDMGGERENLPDLFRAAFKRVLNAWTGGQRDWVKLQTKHSVLLLTAGQSWGDSVQGVDDIALFVASGAAEAAGFTVDS